MRLAGAGPIRRPVVLSAGRDTPTGGSPADTGEGDGQVEFYRRCLRLVPGYLRGEEAPIAFDAENVRVWEDFLGCDEFQACRTVLLDRMALTAGGSPSLLDLCHGPGWGIERAMVRWPEARITAIDFTDAFSASAKRRAEQGHARNAARGRPSSPSNGSAHPTGKDSATRCRFPRAPSRPSFSVAGTRTSGPTRGTRSMPICAASSRRGARWAS